MLTEGKDSCIEEWVLLLVLLLLLLSEPGARGGHTLPLIRCGGGGPGKGSGSPEECTVSAYEMLGDDSLFCSRFSSVQG